MLETSQASAPTHRRYINGYTKSLFYGILLTLAFAPFNLAFMVVISFTLFLGILERCPNIKATIYCGFLYGFGYFCTSLYSFSEALLLEGFKFAWLLPLSLFALPAVLSLIFIVPIACCTFYIEYATLRALIFGNMWFVSEYIRANFIWPFPWNMLGCTLTCSDVLLQSAFLFGIYGCTYIVAIIGAIPHSRNIYAIIAAILQLGFMAYYGYSRTENALVEYHENIKVRLIQPNLAHHFGHPELQAISFEQLVLYSFYKRDNSITHIFWPEASFPYLVGGDGKYEQMLRGIAPTNGAFIFGADRKIELADNTGKYYNSVLALDSLGKTLAVYDKETLVPFGEFIPMRKFLPFMDKIAYGASEFSPGFNSEKVISLPNFPKFLPLICYEIIFPDLLKGTPRPDFLLNITNEVWFGNSLAPDQMFAMARFRAAEYGLPVIRVSNHGLSAVIDPYGRVLDVKPVGFAGYIESKIPKRVNF
jgi:apolipoprotein N-acyltransferase